MPGIDINSYRGLFNGGVKAFNFYYTPYWPGAGSADEATYLVRSTTLPETAIEEITTNWQGVDFKFAGKYTYSDWTVTFNCDSKAMIHKAFYDWMTSIHNPEDNTYTVPSTYMLKQTLYLISDNQDTPGDTIAKYELEGAWPKNVGTASLDYSTNDVVQFDVTFSYIYHTVKYGGE
jgi:hypothetical protein